MRHNFSKRKNVLPLPTLSSVQLESYEWLKREGMDEVLDELGTVEDYTGRGWVLKFSEPSIDGENLSIDEALRTGRTFDAPWYLNAEIKDPQSKKSKKKKIYMGDIPLMTPTGTFVINGVERVVINQITRSYGVIFSGEASPTGGWLGGAKILPKNGVWIDISTSRTGVISVKIDRRRKMSITTLLRIFGLTEDDAIRGAFANVDTNPEINYIDATLAKDPASSVDEAIIEVYRKMRPGEPLVLENAKSLVDATFFNKRRYSLGKVGRFRMNQKLNLNFPNESNYWLLQLEDLIKIVSTIIQINNGEVEPDDIDHLGNRRIRSVGELLQNEIRIGFLQIEKNIKERMSLQPREELPDPSLLISPRAVTAKIHSFFASGQLSQFQDQQNPLTALDHLRRISVTGPGGLTRERASMAVRDVHFTHYGRVCPVRTPEGPNIGLINYLAMYSRVNEFGFLETPYFKLEKEADGRVRVTNEVVYLSAYEEDNFYITDSSIKVDEDGYILQKQVPLRRSGDFTLGDVNLAAYVEVVPRQVVGISAGMIPFLENDDVSRSLIATQQMSQAVPLVRPETPIVGTGIEAVVADNAGAVIRAESKGVVEYADANKIIIKYEGQRNKREYLTRKFVMSNQSTCFNQIVKVDSGQSIRKGDILMEGPAAEGGELAIGTNVKVAYMIWGGYEYEDGIVLSERLVKDDTLTSIHITNHTVQVLETKLGPEEITRDIPNVSEEALRNLDEDGIVAVGSKVGSGDILVGKVAPKGETELSAEERLLRAIFGEKAKEVRDNSLVIPHGEHGVVIGVKRVTRAENKGLPAGVLEEITVYVALQKKIEVGDKLAGRHGNKGVISAIVPEVDMPHMEDGTPVDIIFSSSSVLSRMNVGQLQEAPLGFAGKKLGKKYSVPVFESPNEDEVSKELAEANLPVSGKMKLIDGRTGESFENEVVVGETYILKLIHLGEDKMHARSTGPYSLITQQPLGGKAQFGGQRFGEMEVWALESYGAAHILREMLTIKSDDLIGRTQAYKAILQGEPIPEATIPESFKLFVREINGLGIGVEALGSQFGTDSEESGEPALSKETPAEETSIKEETE